MARNHKFFFDADGSPKARGPSSEKVLMSFLEQDVQGSDHICRDLMDDLTAIEDESDDLREFIGNAHRVSISPDGVVIAPNLPDADNAATTGQTAAAEATGTAPATEAAQATPPPSPSSQAPVPGQDNSGEYHVALKHFREVLEDWEAFILDDQLDDPLADDDYL